MLLLDGVGKISQQAAIDDLLRDDTIDKIVWPRCERYVARFRKAHDWGRSLTSRWLLEEHCHAHGSSSCSRLIHSDKVSNGVLTTRLGQVFENDRS